ncbi:MAG: CHASE2 domain-containing protein [Chloroflexota bacterium]|nr:CHASE2 domain-containing protein [Chloroflexota bacterium]
MTKAPIVHNLRRAVIIAVVSAVLLILLYTWNWFGSARLGATDILFSQNQLSDAIVIVAIDDASLAAYGRSPLDWTRVEYVRAVTRLSQAGARVIAFELLMPEAARGDEALALAMQAARTSDIRTRFVFAGAGSGRPRAYVTEAGQAAVRFTSALLPVALLATQADYIGVSNTLLDQDGTIRRQLSVVGLDDQQFLSFSLATYLAYLRVPAEAASQVVYAQDDTLFVTPERRLQMDRYGQWLQDYSASIGRGFPVLSFRDVVTGRADLSIVNDRIVLIGLYGASGAVDTYAVPVVATGEEMAGIEIQAHAIQSLISSRVLTGQSSLSVLAMLLITTAAAASLYEALRWYLRPVAWLILLLVLAAVATYLYSSGNTIISVFDAALGVSLPLLLSVGWYIRTEAQWRQAAEQTAQTAKREKALLETMVLGLPNAAGIVDESGNIRVMNPRLRDLVNTNAPIRSIPFGSLLEDAGLDAESLTKLRAALAEHKDFDFDVVLRGRTYQCAANWLSVLRLWVFAWADVTVLAELNQLKRHMLLMVSHDLRNPLSSISLQAHQLRKLPSSNQESRDKSVRYIEQAVSTMQTILSDVIDLEQVRSLEFPREQVSLIDAIQDVLERYESDIQTKKLKLTTDIVATASPVHGNRGQLTQVIANLVSNAVKYTPEGGTIALRLHQPQPEVVWLEVEDTGIGIAKEAQEQLFNEFYRVKTRATSEIPGTGLGLSIARTVVRKYGGRIWVDSTEGVGSTFYVELPATVGERVTA